MNACRPDNPQPQCLDCVRRQLPTEHKYRNGVTIADVVMDVLAILPRGKPCPLRVPAQQRSDA